ncbi:hypothetical protein CSC2_35950 [Clostridium zeae]|uniref:Uncharacterized protein n=1 Tax=Clostridium zeae TaxID=2759022 RepID=A0ABQ1EE84_9CLOT|nr:AC3_0185 family rSAM-modified Cys-rich RiPP [Clostridium zeae]GFZ33069.1 hypothetical protein CSC2_35950 [Clostridium zeae]
MNHIFLNKKTKNVKDDVSGYGCPWCVFSCSVECGGSCTGTCTIGCAYAGACSGICISSCGVQITGYTS